MTADAAYEIGGVSRVLLQRTLSLVFLSALTSQSVWSDTYRIDRQSQWEEWSFPAGLLEFAADGSMTPRQILEEHKRGP